jgi:hypothetical protein
MRDLRFFTVTATLSILLFGGASPSHALAELGVRFDSHSGAGVNVCNNAGRNSGNIVAGRAEGIGFGADNALCTRPGDTIKGQVLLNVDDDGAPGDAGDDGLDGFVYSVLFDEATGSPGGGAVDGGNFQNELDLLSANELNSVRQGNAFLVPANAGITSTQESLAGIQRGEMLQFESLLADLNGPGLKSGGNSYVIGNFTMLVTENAVTDGRDIFVGFFTGAGGFSFESFTLQSTVTTVGLDVNFVPEPGTAGLFGAALLGVTALARRRKGATWIRSRG